MTAAAGKLQTAVIAFAMGFVAIVVGIQILYVSPNTTGQPQAIAWNVDTVRLESGTGSWVNGSLRLQLNDSGRGIVVLPMSLVPAAAFPFLHLGFADAPKNVAIMVLWNTAQTGSEVHLHAIQDDQGASSWIDTRDLPRWSGDITSLALGLWGQPGAEITITDVSMIPTSLTAQIQSIYSDWTAFTPWQQSSVNAHRGVGSARSSFYPVAVTAAFLILSILAYGLLRLLVRAREHFDWRVVAAMFLTCWIGLDLIWQGKLMQQLELTYQKFYGKDSQGKLEVGTDSGLVKFMREVKQELDAIDARIFVGSSDDYLGMRGAYYLYPFNVFWQRHGPELPQNKYIHRGDYIVLIQPAKTEFNAAAGMLLPPDGKSISIEPILSQGIGNLYRVK